MGSRLLAVTSYGPSAGSARVRVFDWLDWLRVDARVERYTDGSSNAPGTLLRRPGAVLGAEWRLRFGLSGYDGPVLLSRQASPLSSGEVEARILGSASHGAYDFDDALYLARGAGGGRLFSKSIIWRRSVESADVVIAGNAILAERASALNANTVVIPSCVDPDAYPIKQDYAIGSEPRGVWIGSPSTEKYLLDIAPALLEVNRSHGLRLTVISRGEAALGSLDPIVDRRPWSLGSFARELAKADFGVMPLRKDPWSAGKCAYKLLQYGAAGLPLIGSPVGANRDVLVKGRGLAPESVEQWADALRELIMERQAKRFERGRAARDTVVSAYSFRAWQEVWARTVGVAVPS